MTAAILSGSLASVLATLMQAPRGITVKQWITNSRTSGKQGGQNAL